MEYENQRKIVELFNEINDESKYKILLELLNDQVIDLASVMVVYARHLAEYKNNAQQDIFTLSQAGLDLAEKEIKRIPSIKSLNRMQLKTAQAQTLISGGGYVGTKFGGELDKYIDMSIVDASWYEHIWALKTVSWKGKKST